MGQVWAHTRTKCRLWQKYSFLQVETDGDEPGFLSSEEPEAVIITDSGALPRSIQSMAVLVAKTGNDGTKAYENWDEGSKSAEGIVIERVKVSRLRADAESCRRRCVETRLKRVRIKLFSPNAGLFWPTQPARGTDHSGDRSASARTGSAHSIYQAGHKNKCVNGAGNTNARDCDVGLHLFSLRPAEDAVPTDLRSFYNSTQLLQDVRRLYLAQAHSVNAACTKTIHITREGTNWAKHQGQEDGREAVENRVLKSRLHAGIQWVMPALRVECRERKEGHLCGGRCQPPPGCVEYRQRPLCHSSAPPTPAHPSPPLRRVLSVVRPCWRLPPQSDTTGDLAAYGRPPDRPTRPLVGASASASALLCPGLSSTVPLGGLSGTGTAGSTAKVHPQRPCAARVRRWYIRPSRLRDTRARPPHTPASQTTPHITVFAPTANHQPPFPPAHIRNWL
ncbi:hypothetical protein M432DRAFT_591142 [Thermoascus aurantiacus ATCC 26904]